jgi:hypothetical protein
MASAGFWRREKTTGSDADEGFLLEVAGRASEGVLKSAVAGRTSDSHQLEYVQPQSQPQPEPAH